jgi:hypothetical protein
MCDPGRGELAGQFVRIAREQNWRVSLFDDQLQPKSDLPRATFRLIQLQ